MLSTVVKNLAQCPQRPLERARRGSSLRLLQGNHRPRPVAPRHLTTPHGWSQLGPKPTPKTSVPPAIPPFQHPSGSSRTPPTPTRASSAAPMVEDPQSPTPEPDPIAFTTVETELNDDEAASSFKEVLDWLRYLAQHRGQRGRLLDLLATATSSLQDLMGTVGMEAKAMYAVAAASTAPQPRLPKRVATAPTAKQSKRHIQNAITHFKRVSRQLPGAPRDMLLNIVSQSDLTTAPPPLPSAPKPRKRPSCLVKGIRANTIATRLPEGATTPVSFPALIFLANTALKKADATGKIKEILQGVRRHITIVFDRVVDDETSKLALQEVLRGFKTTVEAAHVLERTTYSILKFNAIPTITPDGRPVTAEMAATCLLRHPEWKDAPPLEPPRFILNKVNPDPLHATLQVKVKDTQKASVAKKLLGTSVSFVGVTRKCQPWTVSPTARQCSTCLKWGHTTYVCRARTPQCDQCSGSHLSALHTQHASACKDTRCTHFGIKCANCDDQHHASSVHCKFFKARSSPGKLQQLQKA